MDIKFDGLNYYYLLAWLYYPYCTCQVSVVQCRNVGGVSEMLDQIWNVSKGLAVVSWWCVLKQMRKQATKNNDINDFR